MTVPSRQNDDINTTFLLLLMMKCACELEGAYGKLVRYTIATKGFKLC